MAGNLGFAKFLFFLFFFQDVFNVVLLKLDLFVLVQAFSSLKEVLILVLLLQHWLVVSPRRRIELSSLFLAVLLALLFLVGTLRGALQFPLDGVVFELRTLVLPLLVFFWGKALVGQHPRAAQAVEELVRFYTQLSVVFALSGLVDYFFLSEDFWTWVDVGAVSRAKGYLATTSGPLPDNMYSYFFGRRAFGLGFNPLNLAYILLPTIVFTFLRRQIFSLVLSALAFALSFSRLPFLALAATITLAMLPVSLRLVFVGLAIFGVGLLTYLGRTELLADPSASGHFSDAVAGFLQQLANPVGEGIGAAGIYAGNYSALSVESAILNTANQISLLGLVAYVLFFGAGLRRSGYLHREMQLLAAMYGLTAFLAPQIFVIKSTFGFFFFLGCNAALARRAPDRGHGGAIGQGQPIGLRTG